MLLIQTTLTSSVSFFCFQNLHNSIGPIQILQNFVLSEGQPINHITSLYILDSLSSVDQDMEI